MKRFVILLLAILVASPVFAQVGRYKNIKVMYPGYSLKLDTATGAREILEDLRDELWKSSRRHTVMVDLLPDFDRMFCLIST